MHYSWLQVYYTWLRDNQREEWESSQVAIING